MVWAWPGVKADDTSNIPLSHTSGIPLFPGAPPASDLLCNYPASVMQILPGQYLGQVGAGYLVIIFPITE